MTDQYAVGESPTLNYSPAFRLAHGGFLELLDQNLAGHENQFDWDQRVIYARGDAHCVGVVTWRAQTHNRTAFLVFCYVDPAHRRRGVLRLMLTRLEELALKESLLRVELGTYLRNDAMRSACAKSGFRETYVVCSKTLA